MSKKIAKESPATASTGNYSYDKSVVDNVISRAHYLANQMIYMANHRDDKEKGDPKVGGHSSATSGAIHIMGALHLIVRTGFDHIANKPHASPGDHAFNYLMDLFVNKNLSRLTLEECNQAMTGLRHFSQNGEHVFQSYHSTYDPDHLNFFPSGTVGIPPVKAGYLAHAYSFAKDHGHEVPDAHFWSIIGDSEFREGSLFEATPDFAEREIGNLTWILDYNRQSLDGHRINNKNIMGGTDDTRAKRTMEANGWEVIEVRHGVFRDELFTRPGGENFKQWLEEDLPDYELNSLLQVKNPKKVMEYISESYSQLSSFLKGVTAEELHQAMRDFGGHCIDKLVDAFAKSKLNPNRPSFVIVHTIKGWNLDMAAHSANHSMLPTKDEMDRLRKTQGITDSEPFARFADDTPEAKFVKTRGDELLEHFKAQTDLKNRNLAQARKRAEEFGDIPDTLDINLKMASYPHTQWMLGQLTSKLTRISVTPTEEKKLEEKQKPLSDLEKRWKLVSEMMVPMAPDVGTSTNLNPSMDGMIFGAEVTEDVETQLEVKDKKAPDLIPGHNKEDHFIRFEISEASTMSCMGSYGRMRDTLGIPLLPLMTVYDFFVKRAHDQFFYDLYWKSSFILVGTPAGVTLSPEGAQHGWKSDYQIPNQITWEPLYCQELDWILCDAMRRHVFDDNEGRTGVYVRGVTRGVEQKNLLKLLKTQSRFKTGSSQLFHPTGFPVAGAVDESQIASVSNDQIMTQIKNDVLQGAYKLIDYSGYAGYEPGDNVVNIFALGAMGVEAISASQKLLEKGIYANVIIVTSTDLLVGNLGDENGYHHLRENLGINSDLHLQPLLNGQLQTGELRTLAGRRVPIVSVHDGEPGLLDNLGSIIGVKQEALAVRKHSKCGRPIDVYKFQGIDSDSIITACGKALSETALEKVTVSQSVLQQDEAKPQLQANWRQLWPSK